MVPVLAIGLIAIALLAGLGITTVGPGGVFITAALYGLTDLSSAAVAGTASATFIATGLVGSGVYIRSGELMTGSAREAAAVLSGTGILGALTGSRVNLLIGDQLFGYLLATFLALVGGLIAYREFIGIEPEGLVGQTDGRRRVILATVGGGIGVLGGLLGVGGPVIAVPALVALGMPMLRAVAVAQVQSIFLALFATIGYLTVGAVDITMAVIVGVPQLIGVITGWRVAHLVPPHRLRIALAGVLVVVAAIITL
ncbi:sulfite exporter TauE/SafE family protein [Halocatena pleomorpha]|uniref:Probable membrane transporter protein n=1 Tax=Halocatena pleomorpha TaxID=1785090 RepID=A0A3P3REX1_9EURY|nr:sulfite exporter TauE/SafE family protein [Halocatena pleomorpha]RRJ31479.1 sulfite exporter TauE/SafE family protein [Halocatena pleomorpha]